MIRVRYGKANESVIVHHEYLYDVDVEEPYNVPWRDLNRYLGNVMKVMLKKMEMIPLGTLA